MDKVKNVWLPKGSMAEKLRFPSQYQLRLPLLEEIERRGGSTRPADKMDGLDLYDALGRRVGLSEKAMRERRAGSGASAWRNHVAWVRFTLVKQCLLVSKPPGTWSLTALGRKCVRAGAIEPPKAER